MPSEHQHQCRLGIDEIKSCFPPLHPRRSFADLFFRRLRQYVILDMNDKKCKSFFSNSKAARSEFKRQLHSPHRFIIHPFSKANGFLEMVFILVMIYRYSLLAVVFDKVYIRLEIAANVMWSFLMLSIFFTGYVKNNTREICINPKEIAFNYIRTYFTFDLILLIKLPLRLSTDSKLFQTFILFLTLITYFVRFKTILCSLDNILLYFGSHKLKSFFIYEILKLMMVLHLITCIFVVIPEHLDPDYYKFWLFGNENLSRFEIYWQSFLLVVCYFFGADYAIHITDPVENLVLFLLSFVGRLYTLALIARVLGIFGITTISDSKYEHQLMVLWNYVNSLKIPDELKQRIVTSFQKQSNNQYFDEGEITATLSDTLKTELFLYGARPFIEKHVLLSKIPSYDLLELLIIMESKLFLSNHVFISAGDEMKDAFFISSGTVAGYDVQGKEFLHLKDGDMFGLSWVAHTEHKNSLMTWVALETTEVYCVTRKDLTRYFRDHNNVAKYFKEKVKERFKKYRQDYDEVEESKISGDNVLKALSRGEVLEKQRLRQFNFD